jgi:primosomal protein N' (replication factor Y) (superfamily II helicase)
VVGGRVLVPFRQQRMTGIVVQLHDRKPSVAKPKLPFRACLMRTPVLDEQLLRLGRWIADYYFAPIGEVFRTMLPLNAEFKRGTAPTASRKKARLALHRGWDVWIVGAFAANARRASRRISRARLSLPHKKMHLEDSRSRSAKETLRSATRASKMQSLSGMVRKKWLVRGKMSPLCATQAVRSEIAVLKIWLTENSTTISGSW